MRVALISNVTTALLAGLLEERGCTVWQPTGFGAWRETALMPPKELADFSPELICLLIDRRFVEPSSVEPAAVEEARAAFSRHYPGVPVIVPDLTALANEYGERFYDERTWRLGKVPWSIVGQRAIAQLITPIKKLVAVDLDGTLWEGVAAEDGVASIRPDQSLIDALKRLKDRGVLLAAVTKNDDDLARQSLSRFFDLSDFVAVSTGYDDKASRLKAIVGQLNISFDSVVFVDDSPAERAEMRSRLPEVCVAAFPPQLDALFPLRTLTAEDERRTAMYREERARQEAADSLAFDDYLASLEIVTDIHPMTEGEIARVAQLSQKTNQFNVCTNRYSESDIRSLAADPSRVIWTLHAKDRFGDLGLVAFVLVQIAGDSAKIVDWVMSCRAMNRRIEFTLEAAVERDLFSRGVRHLEADWRKTDRNSPVADLFTRFGFTLASETAASRHYEMTLTSVGRASSPCSLFPVSGAPSLRSH